MSKSDGVQLYLRLIKQKHQAIIEITDALLKALVSEDIDRKKVVAGEAEKIVMGLRDILPHQDVPSWLQSYLHILHVSLAGKWSSINLLNQIIPVKTEIQSHSWISLEGANPGIDFDAVFEQYKKASKLPELFDNIIKILSDIEGSDEIDSKSLLNALEKIISTLKRNKNGSYFSINSSWEFLFNLLKNYILIELEKIPVLGTLVQALKNTVGEMDIEFFNLHKEIQGKLADEVSKEYQSIDRATTHHFMVYDKTGTSLENNSDKPLRISV